MNQAFKTITSDTGLSIWVGPPVQVANPDSQKQTPAYGLFCVLEAIPGQPRVGLRRVLNADRDVVGHIVTVADAVATAPERAMDIAVACRGLLKYSMEMAHSIRESRDPDAMDRRLYVAQNKVGFATQIANVELRLNQLFAAEVGAATDLGSLGFDGLG